jgi:hypothetical protein
MDVEMPYKTSAKKARAKDISGRWKVAEMPDFEEDYLSETRNPHVNLSVKGGDLSGDYEFALESGERGN